MTYFVGGILAGALHVVTGPDHLAAVSPLAVVEGQRSWRSGLQWAIGHTSGVLVIGWIGLALREILPIDSISGFSEGLIGWVLMGIGLWGLRVTWRDRLHSHAHTHDGVVHEHWHAHGVSHSHRHKHAAIWIGMLHGMAGGSHVVGVMPALILPHAVDAVAYLIAFGIGTIAAMTAFTTSMGFVSARLRKPLYHKSLLILTSCAAIAVGAYWVVEFR